MAAARDFRPHSPFLCGRYPPLRLVTNALSLSLSDLSVVFTSKGCDMRAAVFDLENGIADFVIREVPDRDLAPQEIRFDVAAFGLNQADLLLTQGRHYVRANLPIRLGYEACGTVREAGAAVTRFRPGDRVTAIPNVDGPYWTAGESAIADERFVTAWPDGWSTAEASSLWMQYLTPYFPFAELFPFAAGSWILITAATGATGLGSVAMAKLLGGKVIATTRSPAKAEALYEHGAEIVLATDDEELEAKIMRATGDTGVTLICDTLCGPYVPRLVRTLAPQGRMFIHGALAGDNTFTMQVLDLVHRGAGLFGYSLINELRRPGAVEKGSGFILDAMRAGRLPRPRIDQVFPFDEVRSAYARMRAGQQTGKIIVSLEV
jgi:NADPH:quinone reductase-like Zn-dependent oxidoreductase